MQSYMFCCCHDIWISNNLGLYIMQCLPEIRCSRTEMQCIGHRSWRSFAVLISVSYIIITIISIISHKWVRSNTSDSFVQGALEGKNFPPILIGVAVQSSSMVLVWRLQIQMANDGGNESSDADFTNSSHEMRSIKEMLLTDDVELKALCVRCLSDLYQVFSAVKVKVILSFVLFTDRIFNFYSKSSLEIKFK